MKVSVNQSARAYTRQEIVIAADIDKVFNLIANINQWPQWQSDVSQAIIEGDPLENKSFIWTGGGMKIKSRLHTVNPPSEFGWTGRIWWISAVHNWSFENLGKQTKVVVEESLGGLFSSLMKSSLEKGMGQSLQELKRAAEQSN